jgi:kinesin family protein C1
LKAIGNFNILIINHIIRIKESVCINKSLTQLGSVFTALVKKEKHIPYRNSKLTLVLQNYLGGDSKTLMFVNIPPTIHTMTESIFSLRFAKMVNSCVLD